MANPYSNELNITNIKTSDSNDKYLKLLKRLDEEEGLIDLSIEEKLKLAEDHLRQSCIKFCEATATIVDEKAEVDVKTSVTDIDKIQRLFEPKCFKPSLRPPKSQLKSIRKESGKASSSKLINYDSKKNLKKVDKMQQAYYLPTSTWFSSEMAGVNLSVEEAELLSSCATKAFMKFLEEKKLEIHNIFTHILEKKYKEELK